MVQRAPRISNGPNHLGLCALQEVEQLIGSNIGQVYKMLAVPGRQLMLTGPTCELHCVPSAPPPIPPAVNELV